MEDIKYAGHKIRKVQGMRNRFSLRSNRGKFIDAFEGLADAKKCAEARMAKDHQAEMKVRRMYRNDGTLA